MERETRDHANHVSHGNTPTRPLEYAHARSVIAFEIMVHIAIQVPGGNHYGRDDSKIPRLLVLASLLVSLAANALVESE